MKVQQYAEAGANLVEFQGADPCTPPLAYLSIFLHLRLKSHADGVVISFIGALDIAVCIRPRLELGSLMLMSASKALKIASSQDRVCVSTFLNYLSPAVTSIKISIKLANWQGCSTISMVERLFRNLLVTNGSGEKLEPK